MADSGDAETRPHPLCLSHLDCADALNLKLYVLKIDTLKSPMFILACMNQYSRRFKNFSGREIPYLCLKEGSLRVTREAKVLRGRKRKPLCGRKRDGCSLQKSWLRTRLDVKPSVQSSQMKTARIFR